MAIYIDKSTKMLNYIIIVQHFLLLLIFDNKYAILYNYKTCSTIYAFFKKRGTSYGRKNN